MKASTILSSAFAALALAKSDALQGKDSPHLLQSSMASQFAHYTAYSGPKQHVHATPSPIPKSKIDADTGSCAFWMEDIKHQGVAAFNGDSSYTVFRNVMDYGAKGDGVTDDTSAINAAISDGGRSGPSDGRTPSDTAAVVYFPSGTYLISTSIFDFYYTQLVGNPNCMPVLKATPNFVGFGLIDGDAYQPSGNLGFGATNVFFRQIKNIVFDMTGIPGTSAATGIHWPTSQATSLQNLVFKMSADSGTQHQGVFIEGGSGGFANDLVFEGGLYGMNQGNQQFTMRNLTFTNSVTAISQIWDWGWSYSQLSISGCQVGIDMSGGGSDALAVGAVVIYDSVFQDTPVGIKSAWTSSSQPVGSGSLVLENVQFNNVNTAIQNADGSTSLAGSSGTSTVDGYAQGTRYTPTGPNRSAGTITPNTRPSALVVDGGNYYSLSKPSYAGTPVSGFVSARDQGAKGDGTTDDTDALQQAINSAASSGSILFVDAGTYLVKSTISVPPGARIIGESFSVIMSSGDFFNDDTNPKPVVQVGTSGQSGNVEWSDMIVSTQGQQTGAILIEWNLASPSGSPSGMWDVHTRIGGFTGSQLQVSQCPTTPGTTVDQGNFANGCVAAYMGMHVTKSASGLYMENNWLWTADHDVDDASNTQVTIYAARGFLCESTTGAIWMIGTGVEHFTFYQYQFLNTKDIMLGQIQTETPYYQPNPNAPIPFTANSTLNDPTFPNPTSTLDGATIPNADAWGLRVVDSSLLIYGAGHYSFFNNYSTDCSNQGNNEVCQARIVSLESTTGAAPDVSIYDLHTVGTHIMLSTVNSNGDRTDQATWSDNDSGFSDEISMVRTSA